MIYAKSEYKDEIVKPEVYATGEKEDVLIEFGGLLAIVMSQYNLTSKDIGTVMESIKDVLEETVPQMKENPSIVKVNPPEFLGDYSLLTPNAYKKFIKNIKRVNKENFIYGPGMVKFREFTFDVMKLNDEAKAKGLCARIYGHYPEGYIVTIPVMPEWTEKTPYEDLKQAIDSKIYYFAKLIENGETAQ